MHYSFKQALQICYISNLKKFFDSLDAYIQADTASFHDNTCGFETRRAAAKLRAMLRDCAEDKLEHSLSILLVV